MDKDGQKHPVMTLAEVSELLKVSEKTISRLLQNGEIPGFKVSNQWRFHRDDIEKWLRLKRGLSSGVFSGRASRVPDDYRTISLNEFTGEQWILPHLPVMRLEDVLVTMAGRLVENGIVTDVADFVDGLLERERMSSTSLGEGVAIPHLRNPEQFPIIRPLLLVATCPGGIDWNAPDGEKVRLVMMPIAGSEVTHLRILSSVAGYLRRHEGLVDRMISAESAAELYALLYKRA